MTVSTDGQICFGILLEDGVELPWDSEQYDNDPEDWWLRKVLGYKPPFEIFTPEGDWVGGYRWSKEKVAEYDEAERAFKRSRPGFPVRLVNYCSGGFPMYIIAVPGTCHVAGRGYPESFDPSDLRVKSSQAEDLIAFCSDHGIEYEGVPRWYLSSYWSQ